MFSLKSQRVVSKRITNNEYCEPYLMDHSVSTGKGDTEFYIETRCHFKTPIDSAKKLRSFDGDVGVQNQLRKLERAGENVNDVISSGRFASPYQQNVNAVNLPRTREEVEKATKYIDESIAKLWHSLPDDLRGHMSVEDFCKKYDPRWLKDYVKKNTKVQEKEGDK